MTNANNITVMIYFIFVQHVNHRIMQITRERSEYGLRTNSVKLMQQMNLMMSEDDSNVCN